MSVATMLFFFLLIIQFSTIIAQKNDSSVSLGSSLSPGTNKSYWLSNSGQFAFGFYQQGNGFAVGIWFERTKEKTVVWTANRDDSPLPRDVILLLSDDGRLVVQSKQGKQLTISSDASQPAASASMLDSGNFVLYDSDSRIIWKSFDSQTDTLLPGQPLMARHMLFSSVSESNHSTGRFKLRMQGDGNLVQYPADYPANNNDKYYSYWASDTYGNKGVSLNLDIKGEVYLLNSTRVNVKTIFAGGNNLTDNVVYRLTLDVDGILRLYSHSLVQNSSWVVEWYSVENKCTPLGLCGLNSYCVLGEDEEPNCKCLPGFDLIDQRQGSSGCKRNLSTSCTSKNQNTPSVAELDGFIWENNSYSMVSAMSKNACKEECLRDSSCQVALFWNQQCNKLNSPVNYAKRPPENGVATTLIKVCNGSLASTDKQSIISHRGRRLTNILLGLGSTCFAAIMILLCVFLVRRSYFSPCQMVSSTRTLMAEEIPTLRSFTFKELQLATNGFNEQLGRGAFGTVFKGTLPNGQKAIAVKRLEKVATEGEVEFQNEMRSIGKTHHRNLLRLLGYCHEGTNRLLVYDYMSNGSLADFLFKSQVKPNWDQRVGIAFGIAKGILYLHEDCEHQILHCDINPNNILIDENHSPKIADFGLAKLLMPDQTRTITGIRGTRGFVAPEWHKNLPITAKADVYSFGIVLLVIICCRRSVDINLPDREAILVDWVHECFKRNEVRNLVQDEEVDAQELERMLRIGLWCIQEEPIVRPTMKNVVAMFEGTVNIPVPPYPNSDSGGFVES
ncbi:G-type lectin S-receptor-like serine/threonine-protein kinase LECRK3 [Morus notabilis]|nr:G-type lectin S-receptor-like serine/threonine-protein kinase LECRK3 [Morus notabilis]